MLCGFGNCQVLLDFSTQKVKFKRSASKAVREEAEWAAPEALGHSQGAGAEAGRGEGPWVEGLKIGRPLSTPQSLEKTTEVGFCLTVVL